MTLLLNLGLRLFVKFIILSVLRKVVFSNIFVVIGEFGRV